MYWANPLPLLCFFIMLIFNSDLKMRFFFIHVLRLHTLVRLSYFLSPPPLGALVWAWIEYIVTTTGSMGGLGFLLRSMFRQEAWSKAKQQKTKVAQTAANPLPAASGLQRRWEGWCGQPAEVEACCLFYKISIRLFELLSILYEKGMYKGCRPPCKLL